MLPEVRDLRRIGSAALDLCYVASGALDAYYEEGTNPWDVAAGGLIVTEAGGDFHRMHARSACRAGSWPPPRGCTKSCSGYCTSRRRGDRSPAPRAEPAVGPTLYPVHSRASRFRLHGASLLPTV